MLSKNVVCTVQTLNSAPQANQTERALPTKMRQPHNFEWNTFFLPPFNLCLQPPLHLFLCSGKMHIFFFRPANHPLVHPGWASPSAPRQKTPVCPEARGVPEVIQLFERVASRGLLLFFLVLGFFEILVEHVPVPWCEPVRSLDAA